MFAERFFIFSAILAIMEYSNAQWIWDIDLGCITPGNNTGDCISIKNCKQILEVITLIQPLTVYSVNELLRYRCGMEGSPIKVCCPRKHSELNELVAKVKSSFFKIDYLKHKNAKLLSNDCGLMNTDSRIVKGNRTALFEFPFMALLYYDLGYGKDFKCAGSIINDLYILTAAHCLTNLGGMKLLEVRVGEHDLSSTVDCTTIYLGTTICADSVQNLAIEESIPHPHYDTNSYVNDIGLIRLKSKINMNANNVKPICLPLNQEFINLNLTGNFTVTGWGVTETGKKSMQLLKVVVPVVPQETCLSNYQKKNVNITKNQLCAGGKNGDSCAGDSGGPFLRDESYNNDRRFFQYGIVSFGPRLCGQIDLSGVYTRVDNYIDWIMNTIRQ